MSRDAVGVGRLAVWCRAWSSCRGSPRRRSGCGCWRFSGSSRCATGSCSPWPMTGRCAARSCALRTDDLDPAHRNLRVRAETTRTRRERVVAVLGAHWCAVGSVPALPRQHQPGAWCAVFVGVTAQPRPAADVVNRVEGGALSGAGRGGTPVLPAHHRASVPDRPGPDRLRDPHDRVLHRASQPSRRCAISSLRNCLRRERNRRSPGHQVTRSTWQWSGVFGQGVAAA
jgi:hypothetical protein